MATPPRMPPPPNHPFIPPLSPLTPKVTYSEGDPTDFINRLPAYDQSEGTDVLLDLLREIIYSGNYYWVGASFPYGDLINIPAFGTSNGTVSLPPGTYITSINYFNDPIVNPEGFKLLMYDKGTKAPIAYGGFADIKTMGSDMQVQNIPVPNPPSDDFGGTVFGPGYLISPFIITPPGVINWDIVNLSPNPVVIQVMLGCAVPIRADTLGHRRVNVNP